MAVKGFIYLFLEMQSIAKNHSTEAGGQRKEEKAENRVANQDIYLIREGLGFEKTGGR